MGAVLLNMKGGRGCDTIRWRLRQLDRDVLARMERWHVELKLEKSHSQSFHGEGIPTAN